MTKLSWNSPRDYDLGIDRGVFYLPNVPGVAWPGLSSVTGNFTNSDEISPIYIDGRKIPSARKPGNFSGTISTYEPPDLFWTNVLTQSRVKQFGLSYRINGDSKYKLHLVYNILALPKSIRHDYALDLYDIDFTTIPTDVPGTNKSSHLVIETDTAYSWTVSALEDILYGTTDDSPRLPTPQEVFQIFEDNSILQIIDLGDGSFQAIGPDYIISQIDDTSYSIDWPSVVQISGDTYTVHSL